MKKQKTLTMEVYEKIKNGDKLEQYEINNISTPTFPTVERSDFAGEKKIDSVNMLTFLRKVNRETQKASKNKPADVNYVCYQGSKFASDCEALLNALTNGPDLPTKADGIFERGTSITMGGKLMPITFDKDDIEAPYLLRRILKYSVNIKVAESNLAESEKYEANKFNREFNER